MTKPFPDDLDDLNIPDDGVCEECGRLVRGHAGVQRVLWLRGIKRAQFCWCPKVEDC